ncbi:MAG: hypothetical protein ABIE03_05820 [Patescibacteria group bacterium]|nr:hypothetical protein [Patescibacteria group bacterium]
MKNKSLYIVIIFLALIFCTLAALAAYFLFFAEKSNNTSSEKTDTTLTSDSNSDVEASETTQDADTNEEDNTDTSENYNFTYLTEALVYAPDPDNHVGFKICDTSIPSCTVYIIDRSLIDEIVIGEQYQVSFNATDTCEGAAGTSYCMIRGDVLVEPI